MNVFTSMHQSTGKAARKKASQPITDNCLSVMKPMKDQPIVDKCRMAGAAAGEACTTKQTEHCGPYRCGGLLSHAISPCPD